MSVTRNLSLRGALFGAALAMASSAALAQNRQFSFAYDQPKNSGYGVGAKMFNKKLTELSKGTLSINQYPGAQLGTEAQTMQKVQTGDIDFVMLSTANASTAQPESGVFSIHFIFRDEAHAIKVLGDPEVIAAMKDLYAAKMKGAHMIGLGSQGLRHMYGKKPVQKVADLKGVKMRVQATVTEDTTFPAYGAQVVHMPFGEVYTALQTGVADMAENGINNYLVNKHYEAGAGAFADRTRSQQCRAVRQRQGLEEPERRAEEMGAGGGRRSQQERADRSLQARARGAGQAREDRRQDRQERRQERLLADQQADPGQARQGSRPERREGSRARPQREITSTFTSSGEPIRLPASFPTVSISEFSDAPL